MLTNRKSLAHPERFERPTLGFVVRCSIQLSYGCAGSGRLEGSRGKCNPVAHRYVRPYRHAMRTLTLLALPLALSSCNFQRADAPSLLPRPIETRGDEEVVRVVEAKPDATLDAEIAKRGAALDAATAAFEKALASARPMIEAARGDPPGSDAWIAAQAMLTELGTGRATSDSALSDLEHLAIDRASAGLPPIPELDAKIGAGNLTVEREGGAVAALQASLKPL
jgi:hypothetical protein